VTRFDASPFLNGLLAEVSTPGRMKVAQAIVEDAQDVWPNDSGDYDRSIDVFTYGDGTGVGAEATDPGAIPIEYGSDDTPAQAPMRTAAARHGRFEPS